MSGEHGANGVRVATRRLLVLALLGLASPSAAQDLLLCEDAQGSQFLTHTPCPPGSSYVRRQPTGSSLPGSEAPAAPGKRVTDPAANPLDPSDAALVAEAMRMARFQRAVAGLFSLRIHAMFHYEDSGEWATQPEQLGLDAKTLHSEDIAQVEFRKDGSIEARLRPDFGEGKRIWLQPKPTLGGSQIRWECRTNLRLSKKPLLGAGSCHSTESD